MSLSLKDLNRDAFSGCTGLIGPFTVAIRRDPNTYIPGTATSTSYIIPGTTARIIEAWSQQDIIDFERSVVRDRENAY